MTFYLICNIRVGRDYFSDISYRLRHLPRPYRLVGVISSVSRRICLSVFLSYSVTPKLSGFEEVCLDFIILAFDH